MIHLLLLWHDMAYLCESAVKHQLTNYQGCPGDCQLNECECVTAFGFYLVILQAVTCICVCTTACVDAGASDSTPVFHSADAAGQCPSAVTCGR